MKKAISFFMSVSLIASCLCVQVFALENSSKGSQTQMLSSQEFEKVKQNNFFEAVEPFFADSSSCKVLTADEFDISDEFYSDSIQAYLNEDYDSIYESWGDIIKYVDLIQPNNQIESDNAQIEADNTGVIGTNSINTAYESKGVSKNNLCFWASVGITTFEFNIAMSGSYQVNISEGIITSASSPSITLTDYGYPNEGPCYIGIITRQATISSSGQRVTFYATFHCYREFTSMGNVDDCGLYGASLVGDPNGTLISYSPVQYGYPI